MKNVVATAAAGIRSTGARFSDCGRYRYALWRRWDDTKPYCLFLMLNPSTADDVANDPTVERCERRAQALGYGGLHVANLFAWRSTDRSDLATTADPVGPGNDRAIVDAAKDAGTVICGWGNEGALHQRGVAVLALLRAAGIEPHALAFNRDGTPRHPLYVAYREQPKPFSADSARQIRNNGAGLVA